VVGHLVHAAAVNLWDATASCFQQRVCFVEPNQQ